MARTEMGTNEQTVSLVAPHDLVIVTTSGWTVPAWRAMFSTLERADAYEPVRLTTTRTPMRAALQSVESRPDPSPLWHDQSCQSWPGGPMRLQRRRFSEPSDVRTIPHGRIDVVDLDDTVVGRMTYEPGWRWSVDVQPIAGTDTCQYHHLGVTLSGRLRAQMADGTELELGPGDVFEIPPGHDAWVVGDEPWVSVDFEAMRTYGRQGDAQDERILATMVFTDIVDSTRRAGDLGAVRWRDLVG